MPRATIERTQAMLMSRRRELARLRATSLEEESEALDARSADWPDLAAERASADVLEHLSERERTELTEIDSALRRIEQGTYGRCCACGGPIGRQRLRALPQASLCILCETAAERHEIEPSGSSL